MSRRVLKTILVLSYLAISAFTIRYLSESDPKKTPDIVLSNRPLKALYLNSYHRGFEWSDTIEENLIPPLKARYPRLDVSVIYMDTKRHPPAKMNPIITELLTNKFGDKPGFDFVLTSDNNALDFALSLRKNFLKGVPILFCGINEYQDSLIQGYEPIGGVTEPVDLERNIELIEKLHPNMTYLAHVNDATTTGNHLESIFLSILDKHPEIKSLALCNLGSEELKQRLSSLPKGTVVLNLSCWLDKDQKSFSTAEGLRLVNDNTNCPVYAPFEHMIQLGTVGGVVNSAAGQGRALKELTINFLQSGKLSISHRSDIAPMFDYSELSKWNLDPSNLPSNTLFKNKPDLSQPRLSIKFSMVLSFCFLQFLIVLLLISEIFRRRKLEAEIREHSNLLEGKVKTRTKALEEQISKSEGLSKNLLRSERLAAVGTLASGVAHEFNNINTAVLGFSELALMDRELPNSVRGFIERIGLAAKRSKRIADNMLSFARGGQRDYNERRGNLARCVLTTLELVQKSFEAEGIQFNLSIMPVTDTKVDPDLINQVILNLLTNSQHALQNQARKHIRITVKEEKNKILIRIEDTGCGISKENLSKIFTPFFSTKGFIPGRLPRHHPRAQVWVSLSVRRLFTIMVGI